MSGPGQPRDGAPAADEGGRGQGVGWPLWPLPLTIAAVLALAVHVALWLSIRDGWVPACIPYLEGCTSISRAARHGLGNHLFRLLVLPCALLVAAHWWLSAHWLGGRGRGLAWLGTLAALALAVYATFLGTDGDIYRALRRNGVVVFFGAGFLAQLLFLRGLRGFDRHRHIVLALRLVCGWMLALGVAHLVALAVAGGSDFQDRFENALEWLLGLGLVAWLLAHAALWRASDYRLSANGVRDNLWTRNNCP